MSIIQTLRTAFVTLLLAFASTAAAQDSTTPAEPAPLPQLPPWMTADVINASVAMNMTDTQQPEFNKVVGQFITDHFAMIQKEVKRNAPNLDMRMKSRDRALVHKMDDGAEKVLTPAQLPAYREYKDALLEALRSSNVALPVPSEPRSGPATR